MSLPRNFAELSALEKRAAVEKATGLTWAEYEKLPGTVKTNILLQLQGYTYESGTQDMLQAAKTDSFYSYLRGMSGGVKMAIFAGVLIAGGFAFVAMRKQLKGAK